MKTWNRLLELLGRIIWRIGRVPPDLESDAERTEWFRRYGVSAVVLALMFVGWEIVFSGGSQYQYALDQLALDQYPLVRTTGAFIIVAIVASRVLLATFALGLFLAVVSIFLRRPGDQS